MIYVIPERPWNCSVPHSHFAEPAVTGACAWAQVQYLARLLAIVGIVVLPERLEQLSGTVAEQAAAEAARTTPLGSLEQPRGRLRDADRPPRPEEGAPLDEVS